MDHGGVALIGFVVARGDATKRFEIAEEVLHEMAPGVHRRVARYEARAIALGRDHGESASAGQLGAQEVAVEGLVADQRLENEAGDQRLEGPARQAYVSDCLKAKPAASAPTQGEKLGACSKEAAAKGLKGEERNQYLSTCAKS